MPEGLKIGDLKREHPSIPVNPDIAHICFLHRLIEKIGRGTQKIVEDCKRAKLKAPQWKTSSLETSLTIHAKTGALSRDDLSLRQIRILELLQAKESVTVEKLSEDFDVTVRTLRNDLAMLSDNNPVEKIGKGPSTAYRLISSKSDF